MSVQTQSQTQQTKSQTQSQPQTKNQGSRSDAQRTACVKVLLPNMLVDAMRLCFESGCDYEIYITHRREYLRSVYSKDVLPPGVDYDRLKYVIDNLVKLVPKASSIESAKTAVSRLLSDIGIHVNPKWIIAVWIDACV